MALAVEHFHLYLNRAHFTVVTDHKSLLGIINSMKLYSARLEQMKLRLMLYDFQLYTDQGRTQRIQLPFFV